jgi:hypothetical protein
MRDVAVKHGGNSGSSRPSNDIFAGRRLWPGIANFARHAKSNRKWPTPARSAQDTIARRANRQITVQPLLQKYFGSLFTQITSSSLAIPHPQEGRIAIVTDVGRGMRWTRQCQAGK